MSKGFGATSLTGGATGALDAIPTADLSDGDACTVYTSTGVYHYHLNATSGASENSPYVIAPDDVSTGDQRWELLMPQGAFSHVRAHQTSAQSLANGVWTTLTWDVEEYDDLSEFVHGTGIFTPTYTGKYLVTANCTTEAIAWDSTEALYLAAAIDDTSYAFGARDIFAGTVTARKSASISAVVPLLNTENLRVKASQGQGGAVNTAGSQTGVWLTIDRIA